MARLVKRPRMTFAGPLHYLDGRVCFRWLDSRSKKYGFFYMHLRVGDVAEFRDNQHYSTIKRPPRYPLQPQSTEIPTIYFCYTVMCPLTPLVSCPMCVCGRACVPPHPSPCASQAEVQRAAKMDAKCDDILYRETEAQRAHPWATLDFHEPPTATGKKVEERDMRALSSGSMPSSKEEEGGIRALCPSSTEEFLLFLLQKSALCNGATSDGHFYERCTKVV